MHVGSLTSAAGPAPGPAGVVPAAVPGGLFADPVFVLCHARSGSTLLRFLLDAHPELACPPETNLPALCAQLATVWSLIEGAPLSANRGDEPPEVPDAAITGIRETMDRMVGSYLRRRGKQRYCDKSLGTARFAELLARVYPQARFLCLYRHPMDVIASGLEACPWGLNGYGFDVYSATAPGNSVMALARFWADNTSATLAAQDRLGDRCLQVRYEDLVLDPEATAAGILRFLGARPAPGLTASCFSAERERHGPADYKIWYTSAVTAGSVGRGWSIPTALIGPPLLATINELAGRTGYLPVDGDWGTSAPPADLRMPAGQAGETAATSGTSKTAARSGAPLPDSLGDRLRAGLAGLDANAARRWATHATESLVAISVPGDPQQPADHWLIDLRSRTVTLAGPAAQDGSDWDVIGSASAWQEVISGKLNLNVALRACQLRYCEGDDSAGPQDGDTRLGILADLLCLTHC